MNDALNGKPERSLDDLVGAATGDLRVELATLDVVPFRPTRRRSPLVAGVATIVVVAGAAVWVSRPSAETVVSSPAPPASSGPLATDDQPGSTISSPTRSTAPVVVATPVRDLDVRVPEPLDRPGQNEPFTDPVFGQSISRMTDSTAGEYIAPLTTLTSAFNADETKLLVYRTTNDGGGEHRVLDLTSGASTSIDIAPSDIEEVAWSPTEPDTLIYVDGIDLARYDVRSQTSEVITTFDECEGMATAVGGNGLSVDGDVMPLACLAQSGDSLLAYRFSTGMATAVPREQNPELFTQAPRVAPSGERFVFPTANRVGTVLDASLRPTGVEIDPLTTTAQDSSGADLAVGPSYSGDFAGALVATDLATGEPRVLVAPGPGSTSMTNGITVSATGPVVVFSTRAPADLTAADWATYDGEVVLVDLRGGDPVVTRLAHNRTSGLIDYWSSTFVSVSPSGNRVAFSSDWGTGTRVDTYVIDVRT